MCSCATPSANDATERVAGERPRCCKVAASDDDDDACLTAFFLGGGERWRDGEGWKGWRSKKGMSDADAPQSRKKRGELRAGAPARKIREEGRDGGRTKEEKKEGGRVKWRR